MQDTTLRKKLHDKGLDIDDSREAMFHFLKNIAEYGGGIFGIVCVHLHGVCVKV